MHSVCIMFIQLGRILTFSDIENLMCFFNMVGVEGMLRSAAELFVLVPEDALKCS